ncbi:MAG: hypothetical protein Q4D73_07320 [Actinomycetaceae bacterium]|nr:hypothetical protein [Actinomycetaceae bacterium]
MSYYGKSEKNISAKLAVLVDRPHAQKWVETNLTMLTDFQVPEFVYEVFSNTGFHTPDTIAALREYALSQHDTFNLVEFFSLARAGRYGYPVTEMADCLVEQVNVAWSLNPRRLYPDFDRHRDHLLLPFPYPPGSKEATDYGRIMRGFALLWVLADTDLHIVSTTAANPSSELILANVSHNPCGGDPVWYCVLFSWEKGLRPGWVVPVKPGAKPASFHSHELASPNWKLSLWVNNWYYLHYRGENLQVGLVNNVAFEDFYYASLALADPQREVDYQALAVVVENRLLAPLGYAVNEKI